MPEHDIKKETDKNVISTFGTLVDLTMFKKGSHKVLKLFSVHRIIQYRESWF